MMASATTTSATTTHQRGELECMAALERAGITGVRVHTHPVITTMAEGLANPIVFECVDNTTQRIAYAKNMFLKGKKGELVLVVALLETRADLKVVCRAIGSGSNSFRFAPPEVLDAALGVVQGAVSPLALVNAVADAANTAAEGAAKPSSSVIVVLDKALVELGDGALIPFHPCRNDKSVLLTATQMETFVKSMGNTTFVVDFSLQ